MEKFYVGAKVAVVREKRDWDDDDGKVIRRENYTGIVLGDYPTLCSGHGYGESQLHSYSLLILDADGKPKSTQAWFEAEEMTLLDNDLLAGQKLIEQYHRENVSGDEFDDNEDEEHD